MGTARFEPVLKSCKAPVTDVIPSKILVMQEEKCGGGLLSKRC